MRETFEHIDLATDGKVAVITLNHPETVNALSSAMMRGLNAALDAVEGGNYRALMLTGTGRGFCSGADLKEDRAIDDTGEILERVYHPFLRRLRDQPLPIVTALNGAAVGIGVSLALMGDLIVGAQSSCFLLGFTGIGLVPDGGATWLLPRLIGLARAREMALLADRLPASRAQEWGLINRVVEDAALMDTALEMAQQLATGPASLAMTRRLFWDSPSHSHEQQLAAERAAQSRAGQTDDFKEGLAAFRARRAPDFKGT